MPSLEIMSPLSDTGVTPTFLVEGEDDIPRAEKKGPEKTKTGPFNIKVSYREVGSSGGYLGDLPATLHADATWSCELSLTAGKVYDILATMYDGATPTTEFDLVANIFVSGGPVIGIDRMRLMELAADGTAPAPTGTFSTRGAIFVQLVRFDYDKKVDTKKQKKRSRVVASYHTAVSFPGMTGTWHLYDPVAQLPITKVPRPKGKEKTFVVIATLMKRDWTELGTATQVIRKG